MNNDPFHDVRDKRLGELNPEQQDRAFELWARMNVGHMARDSQEVVMSLCRIIDRLRAERSSVEMERELAELRLQVHSLTLRNESLVRDNVARQGELEALRTPTTPTPTFPDNADERAFIFEPIANRGQAQDFMRKLFEMGLAFHFDDHPRLIEDEAGRRVFSEDEADALCERVDEIFLHHENPDAFMLRLDPDYDPDA